MLEDQQAYTDKLQQEEDSWKRLRSDERNAVLLAHWLEACRQTAASRSTLVDRVLERKPELRLRHHYPTQ